MMGYVVLAVGMAILSSEPPHATPLWSMLLLGLCGVAVLARRRRFPRSAFVGALVLSLLCSLGGSGAELVLMVIAVFAVGTRRSASTAWLCLGIALAVGALIAFVLPRRGSIGPPILGLAPPTVPRDTFLDWVNTFVIICVVLLIATLLGVNVGHRRRHIEELVDRAERLARERDQQAEIAKALERERIAREMHDVIAHSLSVMIAISDGAHAAMGARPEEAKEAIALVGATGRRTLGEVRRLLGAVRGDGEDPAAERRPQPDASHLSALVAEFVAAGLPVRLVVAGRPHTDQALGLTVYRIVQESLTNVLRHAGTARSVTVTVTWVAEQVTIVVHNSASFASPQAGTGRGILGMRERVALYDGVIEAGADDDGGWRVCARLRWEE
ncbi:sensor histidine kinase [Tessaracoccus sp.]